MKALARTACVLRSFAAVAAVLALGSGPGLAQTPRPAAKAANPATLDLLKQRDQELDSVRAEQRKTTESEQRHQPTPLPPGVQVPTKRTYDVGEK